VAVTVYNRVFAVSLSGMVGDEAGRLTKTGGWKKRQKNTTCITILWILKQTGWCITSLENTAKHV